MGQTVLCVMGTRPEVIKMAPVVSALRKRGMNAPILVTAQHRHLLDQMMDTFGLKADWDLDAMQANQSLAALTGRLIPALSERITCVAPNAVLAQGDTTTVFCTALAAFYAGIPFGHVEAGLRSGDLSAPFPEEAMRRLSAVLARWNFAPTESARDALEREGHPESSIHVVGNTVIDSLMDMSARTALPWPAEVPSQAPGKRYILITLHRRENFGEPMKRIFCALRGFATDHPDAQLVYPVHPNPHVQAPAQDILGGHANIHLIAPLDYSRLVHVLRESFFVLSDSGGIQEEAPALGKPVLVTREVTERPEAVEAGGARLVGTDPAQIRIEMERLWNDPEAYAAMARPRFPFGDGQASARIAAILNQSLDQPH